MTTRTVNTKKELKDALRDNIDTIIVTEELEKDLKQIVKVMKMSPKNERRL